MERRAEGQCGVLLRQLLPFQCELVLDAGDADAEVVAMSGSVPKGLDGTAYQRLVKIVKDAGKKVILDTSGKLLEMGIQAAPTLIKPNIDEIRMLTGKNCDDINDIIDCLLYTSPSPRD